MLTRAHILSLGLSVGFHGVVFIGLQAWPGRSAHFPQAEEFAIPPVFIVMSVVESEDQVQAPPEPAASTARFEPLAPPPDPPARVPLAALPAPLAAKTEKSLAAVPSPTPRTPPERPPDSQAAAATENTSEPAAAPEVEAKPAPPPEPAQPSPPLIQIVSADPASALPAYAIPAQPKYRKTPKPAYPATARKQRQEGVVVLRVGVSEKGRPESVEIKHSSGVSSLDAAAQQAVGRWEFEPARKGSRPMAMHVEVPIEFRLLN